MTHPPKGADEMTATAAASEDALRAKTFEAPIKAEYRLPVCVRVNLSLCVCVCVLGVERECVRDVWSTLGLRYYLHGL